MVSRVTHLLKRHVLDGRPRVAAVLVADGQHDAKPGLPVDPRLREVAVEHLDALRVLDLEAVLDGRAGRLALPVGRLRQRAAADDDVLRLALFALRVGAAEDDVFAGRLAEAVFDQQVARVIPAGDALRVLRVMQIAEAGLGDDDAGTVDGNPAPAAVRVVPEEVAVMDLRPLAGRQERMLRVGRS